MHIRVYDHDILHGTLRSSAKLPQCQGQVAEHAPACTALNMCMMHSPTNIDRPAPLHGYTCSLSALPCALCDPTIKLQIRLPTMEVLLGSCKICLCRSALSIKYGHSLTTTISNIDAGASRWQIKLAGPWVKCVLKDPEATHIRRLTCCVWVWVSWYDAA